MADDFERRPDADAFARARDESPDGEEGASEHRIGNGVAAALIGWGVILDVADYFGAGDLFITDLLCVLTIDVYFLYKGFSPVRMFGAQGLEAIPLVGDVLPGYVAGVIFTILQDRSALVADVAAAVPKKQPAGRMAATGTQAASRVRQYASRAIAATERQAERLQKLQERIPGPLRSAPAAQSTSRQQASAATAPSPRRMAPGRGSAPAAPSGSAPRPGDGEGDLPFPDTYYRYERELLPQLDDITADIDVTGERATQAPGGRAAPKRVQ